MTARTPNNVKRKDRICSSQDENSDCIIFQATLHVANLGGNANKVLFGISGSEWK